MAERKNSVRVGGMKSTWYCFERRFVFSFSVCVCFFLQLVQFTSILIIVNCMNLQSNRMQTWTWTRSLEFTTRAFYILNFSFNIVVFLSICTSHNATFIMPDFDFAMVTVRWLHCSNNFPVVCRSHEKLLQSFSFQFNFCFSPASVCSTFTLAHFPFAQKKNQPMKGMSRRIERKKKHTHTNRTHTQIEHTHIQRTVQFHIYYRNRRRTEKKTNGMNQNDDQNKSNEAKWSRAANRECEGKMKKASIEIAITLSF